MKMKRYEGNPILTVKDFPRPVNSVFNAGATKHGDEYVLLNRVEDLEGISCLWVARSQDGVHFAPDPEPAMVGATEGHYATYEEYGIEDPRITRIADTYYVTYTCYSRYAPCVGLARTRDFRTFERMGVTFSRTPEGIMDLRLFGGVKNKRTVFAGASTGQQLMYSVDEQVRRLEAAGRCVNASGGSSSPSCAMAPDAAAASPPWT